MFSLNNLHKDKQKQINIDLLRTSYFVFPFCSLMWLMWFNLFLSQKIQMVFTNVNQC